MQKFYGTIQTKHHKFWLKNYWIIFLQFCFGFNAKFSFCKGHAQRRAKEIFSISFYQELYHTIIMHVKRYATTLVYVPFHSTYHFYWFKAKFWFLLTMLDFWTSAITSKICLVTRYHLGLGTNPNLMQLRLQTLWPVWSFQSLLGRIRSVLFQRGFKIFLLGPYRVKF